MAKPGRAVFDDAVMAALCGGERPMSTGMVYDRMDCMARPAGLATVRAALYRLEGAGRVRLTVRRFMGGNRLIWQPVQ